MLATRLRSVGARGREQARSYRLTCFRQAKFVARAQSLASKYGSRFAPPKSLIEMTKAGKTYQDRSAAFALDLFPPAGRG